MLGIYINMIIKYRIISYDYTQIATSTNMYIQTCMIVCSGEKVCVVVGHMKRWIFSSWLPVTKSP